MSEQNVKDTGMLDTTGMSPRDGRTLLGASGIIGVLAIVGLEILGFNRVLPMLAALFVAAGFAVAAIAWVSGAKRHETEITSWDLAGILAFLGFATAMIAN
jgi:hypothetical protein